MSDRLRKRNARRLAVNEWARNYVRQCNAAMTRQLIEDSADAARWERKVREARPPRGLWELLKSMWKDFKWRANRKNS